MSVEVIKGGLLSSLQDLGRISGLALGMPRNGVLDERAHRVGNYLVGNAPTYPTLEVTLLGPTLRFRQAAMIALGGADLGAELSGQVLPLNQAIAVKPEDVLRFTGRKAGLRSYLAVQGGWLGESLLDSQSTHLAGGYGGYQGRALKTGDVLEIANLPHLGSQILPAQFSFGDHVVRGKQAALRMIRGPEAVTFTESSLHTWAGQTYTVQAQSNRMGCRLAGPILQRTTQRELLSVAVSPGTVQVPPDGQPIVLLADAQTTGGYPRIAQVISVDLPRFAQRAPQDAVHMEWVDIATAQVLSLAQQQAFDLLTHTPR